MLRTAILFFGFILLLGCGVAIASWPRIGSADPSALQLEAAFEHIQTGVTPASQLSTLGLNTAAAAKLSYLGVMEQFMPKDSVGFDNMDPALQACLEARDGCTAYIFTLPRVPGVRGILLIEDGRVAYKKLSGLGDMASNAPVTLRAGLD